MKTNLLDYGEGMHISDGILEIKWIFFWYIISAFFIALGVRIINKRIKEDPVYLPRVSLLGAVVFVISVWHIPVPITGSSSHPVGTPMASIIIGPFAAVVVSAISLFFHSFIAHGGLTTIGANTFSMGIIGAFGGYFIFRMFRIIFPLWFSAGMAGLFGSILTYLATALQLALSLNPDNVFYFWKLYSIGFIPTQLPIAIGEFALTAYVMKYISKMGTTSSAPLKCPVDSFTLISLLLMVLIGSVILAGGYSGYLDGKEMTGIDTTVEEQAAPGVSPRGIGVRLTSIIGEPLAFAFAGITGGLFTGYFWKDLRRGK